MEVKTYEEEEMEQAQKRANIFIMCAFIVSIILIVLLVASCGKAFADEIPESRAVNAIIGEAEGEGDKGMLAIACSIRNRGTLKGVYGEKAPRVISKKYSKETYQKAVKAWRDSASRDITFGADHWGSKHVDGKWIEKMRQKGFVKTFEYKSHVFFKEV